jgi:hypothetical protein
MIYIILITVSFIAGLITGLLLLAYMLVRRNGALTFEESGEETYSTLVIGEENMKDERKLSELAQGLIHRIKNFKSN